MSQESVEVVQASLEAWNAEDMDAFRELHHPDAILRMVEGWPEPGPYFGRDAVMREYKQLRDTWDTDTNEVIGDFIDVGDRVVVRFIWRGAGHGPESNMEFTVVYTVRKGRILVAEYFLDHAEALETMGLSESEMSQDNVEAFRRGIEAFNRGDTDALLEGFDPEIRFEHRLAALQGKFVGVEAVRGWFADLDEYFLPGQIDCSDIRDLGDDRVLALGTVHAVGRESGVETELPYTVVATFRDGRVTHFTDFADREKALEAAGLRE